MIDLTAYDTIVFVCTGNTCRSPMAEAILKNMKGAEKYNVVSRGLVVLFPEPSNQKAEMVVKDHGLSFDDHISTQLQKEDMGERVLVLCMSFAQKVKIAEEFGLHKNLYTIKEYAGEDGDVMDPYGGTVLEYEQCFDELSELMKKVIVHLDKEVLE